MKKNVKKIGILGAGLVGSLLSIYLKQRGFEVILFEKRGDLRKQEADAGRSINLALSKRGIKALKDVGIFEQIKAIMLPMKGRVMHDTTGDLTFQPYGKEGEHINSISRSILNEHLLSAAEAIGVDIRFNHSCQDVSLQNTSITHVHNELEETSHFDLIFGADGAYSQLRQAMLKTNRFNYEQFYLEHGYKELSIPPTAEGDFALNPHALHIWPRGKFMLIALPNLDKSFTCTLFFPFDGKPSFESIKNEQDVLNFFETTFPDTVELMPTLTTDYFKNPTASLVTIKCFPWVRENCVLIGDASHAIVPFYGQGMNAGFEDCYILNQLLKENENDWDSALETYQLLRKQDGDAISDLALHNFVEMRDLVADERFLLQKKIERRIQEAYPSEWLPLYSMVTFSDMRYSEASAIGKKQQEIMDEVMQRPNIFENWEDLDLQKIIDQLNNK